MENRDFILCVVFGVLLVVMLYSIFLLGGATACLHSNMTLYSKDRFYLLCDIPSHQDILIETDKRPNISLNFTDLILQ